ncbi:MAG TPA: hypothetical protein PLP19_18685 [bacterium]|nr:hypothetical protein [bacterium]HPN45526.1 hypothetical protein [bacterium]
MEIVKKDELLGMVRKVFPPLPNDSNLAILIDLPVNKSEDNESWQVRRKMASEWAGALKEAVGILGLEKINLYAYPNVGSGNADLPDKVYEINGILPELASDLASTGSETPLLTMYNLNQLFFAPTEYSATAPLKIAASRYGFRAATMPGFSAKMLPALFVDYEAVNKRVLLLKQKLDYANLVTVKFLVDGYNPKMMVFDLFQRAAHASSGQFPEKGMAGNFPSGECYIVPYEGGLGVASKTKGHLPVQFNNEIVEYRVRQNNVSKVLSQGQFSTQEIEYLKREPAYGNIAELGFGVLAEFGIKPVNEILLDEKLGFHIAFGRSDHFGGITGPAMFSSPKAVVHIDRVYIPEMQPRIKIVSIVFSYPDKTTETIMKDGKYLIWKF